MLPLPHRITAFILGIMFLVFAALQWNDPDPILWIIIYAIPTLLCAGAAFQKIPWWIYGITVVAFLAYAIYLWPGHYEGGLMDEMKAGSGVEEARESLGLLICAVSLAYVGWLFWRKSKTNKQS